MVLAELLENEFRHRGDADAQNVAKIVFFFPLL